jgi:hypothetical protein
VTALEFKALRPEFANADGALVSAVIAAYDPRAPESVHGDTRDQYLSALVANHLALSPAARGLKLAADGHTVYEREIADLESRNAGGPRVL